MLEKQEITLKAYINLVLKSYNFECLELNKKQMVSANVSSDSSISDLDLSNASESSDSE